MINITQLAEQNILEYDARQKHVDELLERVREKAATGDAPADIHARLKELEEEQDRLIVRLDEFRFKDPENWREEEIAKSGLMGLWDALAQQVEKLAERFDG